MSKFARVVLGFRPRWRPALIVAGVSALSAVLAGALSALHAVNATLVVTRPVPVYRFSPLADRMLRAFFPSVIRPQQVLRAYVLRKKHPRFTSLDQVLLNYDFQTRLATGRSTRLDVGDDNMESFWLCATQSRMEAATLLKSAAPVRIGKLAESLAASHPVIHSVLEKMLFQHDVYEMFCVFSDAAKLVPSPQLRARGDRVTRNLAVLLHQKLFTRTQIRTLHALLPKRVNGKYFTTWEGFNLRGNYLPQRVLGPAAGWFETPLVTFEPAHFSYFQGRTFIHIYFHIPGWGRKKFTRYWRDVHHHFGPYATQRSDVPPLPAGTEALLVRTLGVFSTNMMYIDTGFPEEVLIRVFKYTKQKLDAGTSDYRGILQYQYELRRRKLLANPDSLGLHRMMDDAPSFLGFTPEAPDLIHAMSSDLATVRYNCISCHSLQLYGASTLFTLDHSPPPPATKFSTLYGGMVKLTHTLAAYRLRTPEFIALVRALGSEPERTEPRAAGSASTRRGTGTKK